MFKRIKEIPIGTRDIIGNECIKIENTLNVVNEIFNNFSYEQVRTPSVEFYDTFRRIEKAINQEEMYTLTDGEGKILSLKADATLPIARLVASKLKDKSLPIRLRYATNVFKISKKLSGKRNESIEAGIELISDDVFKSDIEAILIAIEVLKALKFEEFKIEIGHVGIVKRVIELLNLNEEEKEIFIELVEEKKLIDLENFFKQKNLGIELNKFLNKFPWMFGDFERLLEEKSFIKDIKIQEYINYIEKIRSVFKELELEKYLSYDLSVASKLNYYSGIVFKGYVAKQGSHIIQGGRYDSLMSLYGRDVSAIGFALNISEVITGIEFEEGQEAIKLFYDDINYSDILKKAIRLSNKNNKVILIRKVNE
ncbi:MAG: ATP phosphoribosyltransferase regulatory subunit [Sarcina sp.]